MSHSDSVRATPRPWWMDERNGKFHIMAEHRGPGSKFCIAEVNPWDDCAKATANHIVACVNANAELVALAEQYRNDMRYPPADDSRQRRIEWIDKVLGQEKV